MSKTKTHTEYDHIGGVKSLTEEHEDSKELWWSQVFRTDNVSAYSIVTGFLGFFLAVTVGATSCIHGEVERAKEATSQEKLAPAHVTAAFEACAKTCGTEGVREASLSSCVCD